MAMTIYDAGSAEPCGVGEMRMFLPGFRFHPTDEELVLFYLKRKISRRRIKLDIVADIDVYKFDPDDLPGLCKFNTGDRQWFFFSPRDRRYPNGARSNRATPHGYWKATGKDRTITCNSRNVGNKKTLVFYIGRAPSGKRTDWVMHEYTLDEEELKRCPDEYDYFALYKVFKKSGPGPKNGEQYGAPFREEDWADEDCLDMRGHFGNEGAVKKGGDIVPVNTKESEAQLEHPAIDLEGIMNQTEDDPVLDQSCHDVNYEYALEQILGEQEFHSTLVNNCSREVNSGEQINTSQPLRQKHDVQASFDLTQSGTSQLHFSEATEVTSAPSADRLQLHVIEEDFLEDFLEMDDLNEFDGNPENFQLDEFDDLFQDVSLFLNESGFDNQSRTSQPLPGERRPDEPSDCYTNHIEVAFADPGYISHIGNDCRMLSSVSQSYNFASEVVSHQPSQLNGLNQFCDQQYNTFATPEANDRTNPTLTPGMDVTSGSNPTALNQNQIVKPGGASGSWLSSALWAFVDSIPTSPASAAETALVNKTLEKMSSFSRLRMTSKNINYAAGNTSLGSKSENSRNGFLCFFIVGVSCALLFVFMGTSSEVLSRFIYS